ncbi:MAG: tRNA 2-thiouridine(34) synthase MnmA [Patescibacteria group bacterium]|nr:tRNA 2-thiouridine(34) synthase MnmA [Patescibacteria group bacterium]
MSKELRKLNSRSPKEKVFVGLSGGVDSSVAALLLKNQGYEVAGIHLRCWNQGGCDEKEAEDARRVAAALNIPFYVFNMEAEYKLAVVDYMIREYKAGLTPNPDVMCNKEIKFGLFLKKALELGADYVATGHYVIKKNGKLYAAKDKSKDQSYFLWTLADSQLRHSLFPIGGLIKPQVRRIAATAGLPTAAKRDSQGICFLGPVTLEEFLSVYVPERRGAIINAGGEKIGEHRGVQFYTVGQRHGLAVPGKKPYYVARKNAETNQLTVVEEGEDPIALIKTVLLRDTNFIDEKYAEKKSFRAKIRTRYRQLLRSGTIKNDSGKISVVFDRPQSFVAPGQSAVFYSSRGEMIGGGVII